MFRKTTEPKTFFSFIVVAEVGPLKNRKNIRFGCMSTSLDQAKIDAESVMRSDKFFKKYSIDILEISLNSEQVTRNNPDNSTPQEENKEEQEND